MPKSGGKSITQIRRHYANADGSGDVSGWMAICVMVLLTKANQARGRVQGYAQTSISDVRQAGWVYKMKLAGLVECVARAIKLAPQDAEVTLLHSNVQLWWTDKLRRRQVTLLVGFDGAYDSHLTATEFYNEHYCKEYQSITNPSPAAVEMAIVWMRSAG